MENYFWNTEEENSIKKLYILVIYDIVDNKRRVRFAKKMNGYGFRVQKSAFEAMVTENLYRRLLHDIQELIDRRSDSVRVCKMRCVINVYGQVTTFFDALKVSRLNKISLIAGNVRAKRIFSERQRFQRRTLVKRTVSNGSDRIGQNDFRQPHAFVKRFLPDCGHP